MHSGTATFSGLALLLAGSLRAALDSPRPDYAARAAELVSAFSHEAMDRVLARDVLPRLLPAWDSR